MTAAQPTGERFIPELMAGDLIEAEHQARYRLVLPHVDGRRVLDAGCGVGWGSQLLVDAGAGAVTGVDIDRRAIADARSRTPGARFVVGDLESLALPAASVDIVVCFEALEHVSDPSACLDELVRVLDPHGLLFVSSPNPDVYPAGNPFHVRELPPAELLSEVGKRLEHTTLLRQHLLVSSLLVADTDTAPDSEPAELRVSTRSIAPLEPGHDPYSMVGAGRGPLPPIVGVDMLAPSHQLDHLETLAATLTDERIALHDDHERMVAERTARLAQHDDDQAELAARAGALAEVEARLVDADEGLQRLTADYARAAAELGGLHEQVTEMVAVRLDLEGRFEAQAVEAAAARREASARLGRVVDERDRLAADLVQTEQLLARARLETEQLRSELEATLETVSWRVTGPLRDVRRWIPRR